MVGSKSTVSKISSAIMGSADNSGSSPLDLKNIASSTCAAGSHARILFGPHIQPNATVRTGNNHVSTTKYELWNIIPKNLFEQFHRAANLWFLIVSIFQMLPLDVSPTSQYATITPLCCVLFLTFCKDAWEDYGRRRDDSRVNNRSCKVVEPGGLRGGKVLNETKWKDVNVGSYIYLENDEPIPADMVVLAVAGEEGVCYVDTAQLDGETSLKPKFALGETMRISSAAELLTMEGHVDAEPPNQQVQSFNGTLFLRGFPRGLPIDAKNLMLRGSTLRNTPWVFGLVVYVGYDTKLVQNLKKTPSKRSRVEVTANYLLLIVFGCLVTASLLSAVARHVLFMDGTEGAKRMSWVWPEEDTSRSFSMAFMTFMIGYNNLIPISLYVTSDLVRTFQGIMMERDPSMYHALTDSGCRVKNSGLNENLGQVEFVLTDKTGTLTENHMQFKACSIQGRVFGFWDEAKKCSVEDIVTLPPTHICMPLAGAPLQKIQQNPEVLGRVPSAMDANEEDIIKNFFLCIATCHTAMVEPIKRRPEEEKASFRSLTPRPQQLIRSASGKAKERLSWKKGEEREPSKPCEVSPDTPKSDDEGVVGSSSLIEIGTNDQKRRGLAGLSGFEDAAERLAAKEAKEARARLMKEACEVKFPSPSPDEEALVAAARDYGYFFRKKVANAITINVRGENQYYMVLICNEFTSDRKRMSVLVRQCDEMPTYLGTNYSSQANALGVTSSPSLISNMSNRGLGTLPEASEHGSFTGPSNPTFQLPPSRYPAVLYVKGADNVMLERISKKDQQSTGVAKEHLQQFSKHGLRTLVLAKRELTDNETHNFVKKMQEAEMAFMNREVMKEEVANMLERDLEILGVTAIEDQIQQGVPDTVNMMIRAGVKVWMLTGDNLETAVNIGLSCKLIDPSMQQYKLEPGVGPLAEVTPATVQALLEDFYNHIGRQLKDEQRVGQYKFCLVLHGKVLYTILEESQAQLRQLFLAIACSSSAVIACRLAPAQKAALVRLVRNCVVGSPLTLAIGDGGNDVSMIQEAHVGVGVLGVEGRQAANAADYVIGQFRFLQPMLFVHGRWNLRRIGLVIGYSFYKNFLLVLPLSFYAWFTGFTGTTLYESYLLTSFNLVFTSLPILAVGVLDVDVSARMALLVPSLYQSGIQRQYFNAKTLIGWIIRGALHALMTFVVMQAIFSGSMADASVGGGHMPDYLVMGSWAYWACVTVANATMMLHTKAWMDWQVVVAVSSGLIFLPLLGFYSDGDLFIANTLEANMVGVAGCLFGQASNWLGLLLVTGACCFSDLACTFAKKELAPSAADVLREIELGRVAGIEMPPEATTEEKQAHAKAYLENLPVPQQKAMKVKPENRVSLRPFASPKKRSVSHSRISIVPVDDDHSEVEEQITDGSPIITVPETYMTRVSDLFSRVKKFLWEAQWYQMTLGELCETSRFDSLEASNHFKNALCGIQSSAVANRKQPPTPISEASNRGAPFSEGQRGTPSCEAGVREREHSVAASDPGPLSASKRIRSLASEERRNSELPRDPSIDMRESVASNRSQPVRRRLWMSGTSAGGSLGSASFQPSHDSDKGCSSKRVCTSLNSKEVVKDLIYSVATLRFRAPSQESAYCTFLNNQSVNLFRRSLLALYVFLLAYNLYELARRPERGTVVRIAGCVAVLPVSIITHTVVRESKFRNRAEAFIAAFVACFIAAKHVYDILTVNDGILMNSYLPFFIMAGTRIRFTYMMALFAFHLLAIILRYYILVGTDVLPGCVHSVHAHERDAAAAEYLVLMFGIAVLSTYYYYQLEKIMRKDFYVLGSVGRSKHQALEILRGMFPQRVAEAVLAQVRQMGPKGVVLVNPAMALCENRGIITVLFCDICDFDKLSQMVQPVELVHLLDLVWMMFDRTCQTRGVMKIETVGKTYMAAAMPEEGSKASPAKHTEDAAKVILTAIRMLELVRGRFTGTGKITKVTVRIGVHTGHAISGIVGSQKPQFALFGDTVNTASRMQSTGRRNLLHISNATYNTLNGDRRFIWESRQTQVKGKGVMRTYLLKRWGKECAMDFRPGEPFDTSPIFPSAPSPVPLNPPPPATTLSMMSGGMAAAAVRATNSQPMSAVGSDGYIAASEASSTRGEYDEPNFVGPEGRTATQEIVAGFGRVDFGSKPTLGVEWEVEEPEPVPTHPVGEMTSFSYWYARVARIWKELIWNENHAKRMTGPAMKSEWVSFVNFQVTILCSTFAAKMSHGGDLCLAVSEENVVQLSLRGFSALLSLVGIFVLLCWGRKQEWGTKDVNPSAAYSNTIAVLVFVNFACSFIGNVQCFHQSPSSINFWVIFEGFFFVMVLMHLCRLNPHGLVPVVLTCLSVAAIMVYVSLKDVEMLFEYVAYTVFVVSIHIVAVMGNPRWELSRYKALCEDNEKVNDLLDSMLPPEVLCELKSGNLSLAYQYTDMTMIFADIVGFTSYCSEHTGEQAVNLVTTLFADFDEMASKLGVYKVCTIGDAYVAVNEPRTVVVDKWADAEIIFKMGRYVLQAIVRVRDEVSFPELDMRIGIHCGTFVGGVIGTQRLRFDIWGEDVLIGNDIESHGKAGMICVSEQAMEVLEQTDLMPLDFSFNKDIAFKDDKVIRTYLCKPPPDEEECAPLQHPEEEQASQELTNELAKEPSLDLPRENTRELHRELSTGGVSLA